MKLAVTVAIPSFMKQVNVAEGDPFNFLVGSSPMTLTIRGFEWSASPLQSPDRWSQSLKVLVSVILAASEPMYVAWGRERTLLYNDAYIPLLGHKHPSALGRPFFDVWNETESRIGPLFERVFAGEYVAMDDITLDLDRQVGPSEAHFAFSYTPLRDDHGAIMGLFCICRETTDNISAKQVEDRTHERLATMFHFAPSFIAMLEGPEHRIVLVNERLMELVGHRPVLGRTVAEALADAVEQGYLETLDRVFKSGQPFTSNGSKYAVQSRPDAEVVERYIDFVYQPVTDCMGRVTGIFVEGMDVTTRVQAEAAVRESAAQLSTVNAILAVRIAEQTEQLLVRETLIRTFYEHSSECYAVLSESDDGTFRYEEINPATLRLYGKTREQVVGRTLAEVLDADPACKVGSILVKCLASNSACCYERAEGDEIIEAVATPVPVELGMRRQVIVSARDVTERRLLQQQLLQAQKMEAVGQLTGGLAHDFNNLLTGITGSLELLQERVAQGRFSDLERYLNAGQSAARRAAALTHRLLAFSRRQTLDARPVNANKLIGDLIDLISRTVGPAINVRLVGAEDLWDTCVDANQLENALINLCINARDAMPDGGKITIETANRCIDSRTAKEPDLAPGHYISVCVSDTGCGMSADIIARAFEPFFTTKPMGEGTGLGLSMIYGFARQSGGQVRLYSELGNGAMVCMYLPRHLGAEHAIDAVHDAALPAENAQGETVLVVDDEPTVRMLVTEVVQELGYVALESADGLAALQVLESNLRIDLLITDVGLPNGINGRQLADAARVLRPGLKVLFITGYAEHAVFSHGHLPHGYEVLTKPFPMTMLAQRISGLMGPAP